jgi:hypothetical protein
MLAGAHHDLVNERPEAPGAHDDGPSYVWVDPGLDGETRDPPAIELHLEVGIRLHRTKPNVTHARGKPVELLARKDAKCRPGAVGPMQREGLVEVGGA